MVYNLFCGLDTRCYTIDGTIDVIILTQYKDDAKLTYFIPYVKLSHVGNKCIIKSVVLKPY